MAAKRKTSTAVKAPKAIKPDGVYFRFIGDPRDGDKGFDANNPPVFSAFGYAFELGGEAVLVTEPDLIAKFTNSHFERLV